MKLLTISISLLLAFGFGCGNETQQDGKKSESKEADAIAQSIKDSKYYLSEGNLDHKDLPEDIRLKSSLYKITVQAENDAPVIGATVAVISGGDCLDQPVPVPVQTTSSWRAGIESNDLDEAVSSMPQGLRDPMPPVDDMDYTCSITIHQKFGPNKSSNSFSLILEKGVALEIQVSAPGYMTKYIPIKKAHIDFADMKVTLYKSWGECYISNGSSSGGESAEYRGVNTLEAIEVHVVDESVGKIEGGTNLFDSDGYDCIVIGEPLPEPLPMPEPFPDSKPNVEIIEGFNIKGEKDSCAISNIDIACTAIYGEQDAFADQCNAEGYEAIQCGCHQYLCSEKIEFKGFKP